MTRGFVSVLRVSMLAIGLGATPAFAQRVFVAAQGSDANPCTFASPCRTFQRAHDAVAAKGEIDVLDPAGYGALTITKSISIQGHGFAGITAGSGTAITLNAGPGDNVNLRGLLVDGLGTGTDGIDFNSGANLNINECWIRNFNGVGISVTFPGPSALFVSDTLIGKNSAQGILIYGPSGTGKAVLDRILVEHNGGAGVEVLSNGANLNVAVEDSVISNNANGIQASSGFGSAVVMVRDSVIANHSVAGVFVLAPNATVRVARSTITGNNQGLTSISGGVIDSYGNNNIDGNTTNGTPTATIPTK